MKHTLPLFLCLAALPAQIDKVITEPHVREVVSWLAADERNGRDTPSKGLDEAAEWLAQHFAAAGLKPVVGDGYFHEYSLPGLRLDSRAIKAVLKRKTAKDDKPISFELAADDDIRLWRAADAQSGEDEPSTVAQIDDPVLQQLLNARSGRRPTLIEVPTDHPFWQEAKGERVTVAGRRAAARPVFLLRAGILPPPPEDGDEAGYALTWNLPAPEKVDVPVRNVCALLPGTTKRDEYVVVSAHYDHVGRGNAVAGDSIYNGADDDASGTTAVLVIAEAMAKQPPPQRSVLFVCFSGEEKGLLGSRAFAKAPPVPREQIVVDVNIEMIGRPLPGNEGKTWITGRELSDFGDIAAKAMQPAGVEITGFPMAAQLFAQSDNYSFVPYGIVAHSLSAGSLHEDYHRPGDEVSKLALPHMTKIIQGLAAFVRELADRDAAPQWNAEGKARVEKMGNRK